MHSTKLNLDCPTGAQPATAAPLLSPSRRHWIQFAGAGALLHALPGCGGGDDPKPDAGRLSEAIQWGRDAIRQAVQKNQATAISVALMTSEGVIWQEAFGVADPQGNVAATIDSRFNIGSVSKVLAALAAMVLCDRGKLALDAPIARYLPGFSMLSSEYGQITLRHLLSHSSGLPGTNWRNIFAFEPIAGYAQDTEDGLAYFHLKHQPGELAVYCNDGFTMVENLVAAVTGQPYAEFVRREILEPLGMGHSAYPVQAFPEGSFVHPVYEGRRMGQEFVSAYATGGLASTPGDMMRLAQMFLDLGMHQGRRLVSQAAIQEMGTDQTTGLRINPCPEWRWGLGWDSVRQPGLDSVGVKAWQKNGGTSFFSTEFFVLPDQRMALLLTGAGTTYGPLRIAEGVLLRALSTTRAIPAVPAALAGIPAAAAPSIDAAGLAGIYANYEGPYKVQAVNAGTIDVLHRKGGAWEPVAPGLTLRADGWWWNDAASGNSYRWLTLDGKHYMIQRVPAGWGHYRLTMSVGQRLTPLPPLSAAWQARLGTRWEPTNESPESVALALGGGIATLDELAELPGYVMWSDGQLLRPDGDDRARMTIQVPVNHGRDLVELEFSTVDGQPQMRSGSSLYRLLAED